MDDSRSDACACKCWANANGFVAASVRAVPGIYLRRSPLTGLKALQMIPPNFTIPQPDGTRQMQNRRRRNIQ